MSVTFLRFRSPLQLQLFASSRSFFTGLNSTWDNRLALSDPTGDYTYEQLNQKTQLLAMKIQDSIQVET